MRLAALQSIWDKFSEALFAFGPSAGMGLEAWQESEHYAQAVALQNAFRREVERHQIVLDRSVIKGFIKLDTDLLHFRDGDLRRSDIPGNEGQRGDEERPLNYTAFVNRYMRPHRDALAEKINEMINVTTHKIELRLSEPEQ